MYTLDFIRSDKWGIKPKIRYQESGGKWEDTTSLFEDGKANDAILYVHSFHNFWQRQAHRQEDNSA